MLKEIVFTTGIGLYKLKICDIFPSQLLLVTPWFLSCFQVPQ